MRLKRVSAILLVVCASLVSAFSASASAGPSVYVKSNIVLGCNYTNTKGKPVLYVRSGPGKRYKVIGSIRLHASFTTYCQTSHWINTGNGYVNSAYVSLNL